LAVEVRLMLSASPTSKARPLYEQLQPLRNGRSREEVLRHQRARLFGAMIETVAERGYADATISQLHRRAGVSKRTVYDLFASKEEYFLATYDLAIYGMVKRLRDASQTDGQGPQDRLRASLDALIRDICDRPKAARLVLLEALGAGRAAAGRIEGTAAIFEGMLGSCHAGGADASVIDPLLLKGVVGGVIWVLRESLEQEEINRSKMVEGLGSWILACRPPIGAELWDGLSVACELAFCDQADATPGARERMLISAMEVVAHHGYENLTVAQIVQRAQCCDELFFECFTDSEQCFVEAVQEGIYAACEHARQVSAGAEDWTACVRHRVQALLGYLESRPALTQSAFVEIFALGRTGIAQVVLLRRMLSELFATQLFSAKASELAVSASAGAVWELVRHYAVRRAIRRLSEIAGLASYLVLAPMPGFEPAMVALRERGGYRPHSALRGTAVRKSSPSREPAAA
jgi:AcrR family transcriptional regulator